MQKDIEFYIELALLIAFGIAIGYYLWHSVMLPALKNCTQPCTILDIIKVGV